jgi:hypothetical protein
MASATSRMLDSADQQVGRELATWAIPLARGTLERASSGLVQPIEVRAHDALAAADCAARHREQLATGQGWPGWSAPLAARRVALEALRDHLDEPGPGGAIARPNPLAAVRGRIAAARASQATNMDEWLAEAASDDERRQVAARASRWLSALLRMTGWPLPPRTNLDAACRWHHEQVTVVGSLDASSGVITARGTHEGWIVRESSGAGPRALRDRACVEALAATLARGIAPARVDVLCADAGDRFAVDVDHDAIRRGVELVGAAVRQAVIAQSRGYDESDATPGPHCRFCDLASSCPPGTAWAAGPGRAQGGLPVLDPD